MKTTKTLFVGLVAAAVATITFAASAQAGGNQDYLYPSQTAGGWGQTSGSYFADGGSWNNGSGPVVTRGSMSESGGAFNGNFSFNGTTCTGETCANIAQAGGVGSAFQRSATFIETSGGTANSNASGNAEAAGASKAYSDFKSGYQHH
ncbi:hypothetical protein H6784_02720 [Candidatus Nomurabacteria bacterium]|nr:hypothetical protein [Candidatus Kaiserbacteria bacterium]MCB9814309.1 hypothetical protein [Candidatus Nomurabacteria bacterium]